jgi:hypothetical protein
MMVAIRPNAFENSPLQIKCNMCYPLHVRFYFTAYFAATVTYDRIISVTLT